MTAPAPYLQFAGDARAALTFYRDVFGGSLTLLDHSQFGVESGHPEWIAHGILTGPVHLFASDDADAATRPHPSGVLFSLLGHADPATLRGWFDGLADGGEVVDPLVARGWDAHDGQVRDRFGLTWLVGWEPDGDAEGRA